MWSLDSVGEKNKHRTNRLRLFRKREAPAGKAALREVTTSATADTLAPHLEAAVGQAIAACDRNPRSAVRVLVIANSFLERELEDLRASISKVYVRGRLMSHAAVMDSGHSGER